jgi:hypothetical protein
VKYLVRVSCKVVHMSILVKCFVRVSVEVHCAGDLVKYLLCASVLVK